MRTLALLALVACGNPQNPTQPASAALPEAVAPAPSAGSGEVVARWKGGEITIGEVEVGVQGKLDAMEQEYLLNRFELLSQALDSAVDDKLLEAEAQARRLPDARALLSVEVEQKVSLPTDAEIEGFYAEVKGQLRGAPLDDVRSMLAGELIQRKMGERYQEFVAELRKTAGVTGSIPYPDLKRAELAVGPTDAVLGATDAPITIVQFAEYQCYYCAKVSPTLQALVEDYDGKVRVVFKDYPLDNHRRAMPSAVAARCAGEQQKYWPMNEKLLAEQSRLEDADFLRHADALKLDKKKFQACLEDGEMERRARANFAEGEKVGVQATPTFYVNGLLVSGAQPYDRFKAVIDQELARGSR
jgi:protein-disulfide isomerase